MQFCHSKLSLTFRILTTLFPNAKNVEFVLKMPGVCRISGANNFHFFKASSESNLAVAKLTLSSIGMVIELKICV